MSDARQPIRIESEDQAWEVIRSLLADEITYDDIDLGGSSFAWARLSIHAEGRDFHSSLPASFMRGLLEFQENFLRTSARILRDSPYITKLTIDTRSDLDIVFTVGEGSTDLIAELKEQLVNLLPKALEKMTGKDIVLVVLGVAVIWGGTTMYGKHLDTNLELQKIAAETQDKSGERAIIEGLLERQDERDELIQQLIDRVPKVSDIVSDGNAAKDAIVRNSTGADKVSVQGVPLTAENIREFNRRSRRTAEEVSDTEKLRVMSIDAAEAHHFKVKLRRGNGTEFTALIRDIPDNQKTVAVLWRSESSRKRVMVEYEGRQIGKALRDVRIKRAWTPRVRA